MRRTAQIGVGAGLLAGLVGLAKALSRHRDKPGGTPAGKDEGGRWRRGGRFSARARMSGVDLWPAVPVKPGAEVVIDAERAGSLQPSGGESDPAD
jgi:hypothetical protein